jgi:histone H3/H4
MSKTASFNSDKLITKAAIRRHVHEHGLCVSDSIFEKVNLKTKDILNEAIKRAKENKRNTVMQRDV